MEIIANISHLDHGLTAGQVYHIKELFKDKVEAFFIETIELPEDLGTVPCNLHGPITGELPVMEDEVVYTQRGNREGKSRMCTRPRVQSRKVTIVAGKDEKHPCVLYTAYGGPLAPREPFDSSIQGDPHLMLESQQFWAEHALGV